MGETYIDVNVACKYLYRAVVQAGKAIDFLVIAKRYKYAAMRFTKRAMQADTASEKLTIDKSGANKSAISQIIADKQIDVEIRQYKYLNDLVEQDHGAIKRKTCPEFGFKSFRAAAKVLAGTELTHISRKGQLGDIKDQAPCAANPFYSLAFLIGVYLAVLLGLMALLRQNRFR